MLTCYDITVKRNNKILFSKLGFTLFFGGCLLIQGRNGIGKTTLLKTIANLTPKISGKIFFNSINVKLALSEFYRLLFYMGKSEILDEEQTVLENLEFWSKLYNQEIKILAAIRTFALEPYINTKVFKLSQGFKQRVFLARLLLTDAKLWLLDEPFDGLDKEGTEMLTNLIKAKCQQQGMVIIVAHNINLSFINISKLDLEDFFCE